MAKRRPPTEADPDIDLGPKAYSYLRFSSPEQAKGASTRRQIEAAAKWAAANGMILDEDLRDEGISAFRGKNRKPASALGGFLKRVETGDVKKGSFLLVESFDRLSREEVLDALELFLGLTRAGITVVTLADGRVYNRASLRSDQTQLIISIVIMARAYEESATKSRRVGDAWSRKRQAARDDRQAMTATCPGWMRLVGGPRKGRYELIPERAEIIRSMFASVIAGDGRRTITKRLNAEGVPTWGEGGNKGMFWHDSYVQKILASPATFGRYDRRDERIEGYFPAVVEEATYWRAKAAAASRMVGNGKTARSFRNLLAGIAKCPTCGGAMTFVDKGKRSKPALRCTKAYSAAGCANRTTVPYGGMEALVVHAYAHFADAAMFAIEEDARRAAAEIDALRERRADAEVRRDRLVDAIEAGATLPSVQKRLDGIAMEIASYDGELSRLQARATAETDAQSDIEERIDAVNAKIHAEDETERYQGRSEVNARLRKYLDRIEVSEDGNLRFFIRDEYVGIDEQMLGIYSQRPASSSDRVRSARLLGRSPG